MTNSSDSSDERISMLCCLYDSVHFISSARMVAASDFSCADAAEGANRRRKSAQGVKMRMRNMSHNQDAGASSFRDPTRVVGKGQFQKRTVTSTCSSSFH